MGRSATRTWARVRAVDARRPEVLDALLALGLFTGAVVSGVAGEGSRAADGAFVLLLAVGSLPYVARRRAPMTTLMVASLPVLALLGLGYTTAVVGSGLFLAAYTVAALRSPRCTALAVGWVAVLLAAVALVRPGSLAPGELLTNAALFAGAFGLGRGAHVRRDNASLLRERAELAERARSEGDRRAVSEERLRIAQELHDVIGHSLGVIALQAQVGAHVIDADPAEAKAALVAVSATSRTALTEVRRILGAMRDETADRHPAPGLGAVGDLAAELSAAGLPVEVTTHGTPVALPTALDVTAYRLVQESLTNVAKHAGRTRAQVSVRFTPGSVDLEVLDDGPQDAAASSADAPDGARSGGHGHLGMRERVAVWGGTLTVGPRPDGGYAVHAHLPFEEQP
ncbi:sensor histidine kinase [Actinotalea sp.]|uniref:sensor histidine kinase n=1 Tax=Actinotalea sp. TaxID=1872145 RepID=UPI0035676FE7